MGIIARGGAQPSRMCRRRFVQGMAAGTLLLGADGAAPLDRDGVPVDGRGIGNHRGADDLLFAPEPRALSPERERRPAAATHSTRSGC